MRPGTTDNIHVEIWLWIKSWTTEPSVYHSMKQFLKLPFSVLSGLDFGIKFIGLVLVLIGVVVFLEYDKSRYNIVTDQNDLIEIRGTLVNKPYIFKGRNGGSVIIHLNEYPEFQFSFRTWRFAALNQKDLINDNKVDDSIQLEISRYDYVIKIARTEKLRFSEKMLNYDVIEPYAVASRGVRYLTLKEAKAAYDNEISGTTWMTKFVLVISVTLVAIYGILRLTGGIEQLKKWYPLD